MLVDWTWESSSWSTLHRTLCRTVQQRRRQPAAWLDRFALRRFSGTSPVCSGTRFSPAFPSAEARRRTRRARSGTGTADGETFVRGRAAGRCWTASLVYGLPDDVSVAFCTRGTQSVMTCSLQQYTNCLPTFWLHRLRILTQWLRNFYSRILQWSRIKEITFCAVKI